MCLKVWLPKDWFYCNLQPPYLLLHKYLKADIQHLLPSSANCHVSDIRYVGFRDEFARVDKVMRLELIAFLKGVIKAYDTAVQY